jgi:hypothetical protein
MERDGIIVPNGTKLLVNNMVNAGNQNDKLEKYLYFFMELKKQPIKNKVSFLISQKKNINALSYGLNQK